MKGLPRTPPTAIKLLDSGFLIHYWGGEAGVATYLNSNDEHEFITTPLNIKEIAVGHELQGEFDEHEIRSTFEWMTIVPFETSHGFIAATLEAQLHRDPEVNQDKINSLGADLLIAAVAKATGATVVTQNVEDFDRFDGVEVDLY